MRPNEATPHLSISTSDMERLSVLMRAHHSRDNVDHHDSCTIFSPNRGFDSSSCPRLVDSQIDEVSLDHLNNSQTKISVLVDQSRGKSLLKLSVYPVVWLAPRVWDRALEYVLCQNRRRPIRVRKLARNTQGLIQHKCRAIVAGRFGWIAKSCPIARFRRSIRTFTSHLFEVDRR